MTLVALRAAHLLFMGLWVGALMYVGGDVRRTVAAGAEHLSLLDDRVRRALRFAHVCGGVTIASGLALTLEFGGFGAVSPAIHAGLGVALLLALGGFGLGSLWGGIHDEAAAARDPARLRIRVRRLGLALAIWKSLWLVAFALMLLRNR